VVRWEFADIVPDYMVGATACVLYLSLRYHLLHPDYIFFRIRELQPAMYRLRIVLCHVDMDVSGLLHCIPSYFTLRVF
jgi:DNA excision repair protein ERCC-1